MDGVVHRNIIFQLRLVRFCQQAAAIGGPLNPAECRVENFKSILCAPHWYRVIKYNSQDPISLNLICNLYNNPFFLNSRGVKYLKYLLVAIALAIISRRHTEYLWLSFSRKILLTTSSGPSELCLWPQNGYFWLCFSRATCGLPSRLLVGVYCGQIHPLNPSDFQPRKILAKKCRVTG